VNPLLTFVACLAGIVLFGFVISKLNGTKSQYLETFPLEASERVLWEDLAADSYLLLSARALRVSYRRWNRNAVRVTNTRIISGSKGLFGPKHVILHVLYPSDRRYPEEANTLTGGFFKFGYKVLVFERASAQPLSKDGKAFFELILSPSVGSSANAASFRIYSDALQTFALPE
jgi:hypothetical protein